MVNRDLPPGTYSDRLMRPEREQRAPWTTRPVQVLLECPGCNARLGLVNELPVDGDVVHACAGGRVVIRGEGRRAWLDWEAA